MYPFDSKKVLKKLSEDSVGEVQENVSQVFWQQLQNICKQEELTKVRRKRVQVDPCKTSTSAKTESDDEVAEEEEGGLPMEESSSGEESEPKQEDGSESENDENHDPVFIQVGLKPLPNAGVKEGDWVKVSYEGEIILDNMNKKTSQQTFGERSLWTFVRTYLQILP